MEKRIKSKTMVSRKITKYIHLTGEEPIKN